MKIKLLDIKGFGKFNQVKLKPAEGFNIIFEKNESGKSTLLAFIRAMLYGLKGGRRSKDGSLPPLKHYKPWNGDQYAGILEYALDNGKTYRVGRNFDKGTVKVYDEGANDITSTFPQSRDTGPQFAEEHLGIDEAAFERSAFISQLQSVIDEEGKKNLIEKLSNLNTTGNEELSLSAAVDAIESALLERVGTKTSTTRPLDRINYRLKELEEEKRALEELNERYLETFASLREQNSRLSSLNEKLAGLKAQKEARKACEIIKLRKELEGLLEENRKKDEEIRECNRNIIKLKKYENMDESAVSEQMRLYYEESRARDALLDEQRKLKELSDQCEKLKEDLDPEEVYEKKVGDVTKAIEVYNEKKSHGRSSAAGIRHYGESRQNMPLRRNWMPFVIPAGFLSALLMLGNYIVNHNVLSLGMGLFLAIATATILIIRSSRHQRQAKKVYSASEELNMSLHKAGFADLVEFAKYKESHNNIRERLKDCQEQIRTVNKQIEELSSRIRVCGEKWDSFRSVYELDDEGQDRTEFLESLKKSVDELKKEKERKRILLAEKDNINDKCELVLREAGMLAGEIFLTPDDLDNYINKMDHSQLRHDGEYSGQNLDGAIKALENEIKETQLKIAALKVRIEDAPAESELTRVIEEIGSCQEKKEALEFKGASLALASQILKEVALKMQKNYIPELNKEMSRMIGIITSGRYSRVSTNDELRINLEVPETEELVTVNRLSGGTIDQVYLCMRLAAVNLLDRGGEKLPLFLDEPFSQYDEERVKKAFELLKEVSKERQVFFFTCREREYELACAAFGDTLHRLSIGDGGFHSK